jgi:hypothetical protein
VTFRVPVPVYPSFHLAEFRVAHRAKGGWTPPSEASTLSFMAISRPGPKVCDTWFSDERSPSRRLHVSWHGPERLIVLSVWHEDRCTATFRMPVEDAGRLITAVVDAMSRAIIPPNREIKQHEPLPWRTTMRRVEKLLWHRIKDAVRDAPGRRAQSRAEFGRVDHDPTKAGLGAQADRLAHIDSWRGGPSRDASRPDA